MEQVEIDAAEGSAMADIATQKKVHGPIVNIELSTAGRIRLSEQIRARMESLGHEAYAYDKLGLGFELPITWPADKDSDVTLAQLTVLAMKLKMKIIISDRGIDMVAMSTD